MTGLLIKTELQYNGRKLLIACLIMIIILCFSIIYFPLNPSQIFGIMNMILFSMIVHLQGLFLKEKRSRLVALLPVEKQAYFNFGIIFYTLLWVFLVLCISFYLIITDNIGNGAEWMNIAFVTGIYLIDIALLYLPFRSIKPGHKKIAAVLVSAPFLIIIALTIGIEYNLIWGKEPLQVISNIFYITRSSQTDYLFTFITLLISFMVIYQVNRANSKSNRPLKITVMNIGLP